MAHLNCSSYARHYTGKFFLISVWPLFCERKDPPKSLINPCIVHHVRCCVANIRATAASRAAGCRCNVNTGFSHPFPQQGQLPLILYASFTAFINSLFLLPLGLLPGRSNLSSLSRLSTLANRPKLLSNMLCLYSFMILLSQRESSTFSSLPPPALLPLFEPTASDAPLSCPMTEMFPQPFKPACTSSFTSFPPTLVYQPPGVQ